eukprot:361570-Chlamydomonas_euryale.AAC.9
MNQWTGGRIGGGRGPGAGYGWRHNTLQLTTASVAHLCAKSVSCGSHIRKHDRLFHLQAVWNPLSHTIEHTNGCCTLHGAVHLLPEVFRRHCQKRCGVGASQVAQLAPCASLARGCPLVSGAVNPGLPMSSPGSANHFTLFEAPKPALRRRPDPSMGCDRPKM